MPVCSRCGFVSQNNDRYCLSCGYPLNASDAAAPVATPSPNGASSTEDNDWANATVMEQPVVNTPAAPAATATAIARLFIRPLSPEAGTESREYLLDGKPVAVGRSPSCEIVLENDQLTSRRHAQLRFDGDHYSVVDLGSSNGTFVNENEIREATPLKDGDRVIIGEHEFLYTIPSVARANHGTATPSMPGVSVAEMAAVPPADVAAVDVAEPAAAAQPAADIAAFETVATASATLPETDSATASATASAPTDTTAATTTEDADVRDVLPDEVVDAPDAAAPVAPEAASQAEVGETSSDIPPAESAPEAHATEVEPGAVADVADVAAVADAVGVTEPVAGTEVAAPEAEASAAEPETPAPAAQGAETAQTEPVRSPTSGALRMPGGDLDSLRTQIAQLTQTTELLSRHADEEAELGEQRYVVLLEARNRLSAILDAMKASDVAQPEPEPEPEDDYSDLIAIARQTAENPNHLQYVSRLAEHAGELTQALEQLQARKIQPETASKPSPAIAALEALRARLDELA